VHHYAVATTQGQVTTVVSDQHGIDLLRPNSRNFAMSNTPFLQHLRALRRMKSDGGWIRVLIDEAENERMHLMTFIEIAKPTLLERGLILLAQGAFFHFFFLLYLILPGTAHRMVGYLEEEAVVSYTEYLVGVDYGTYANVPAPQIAIDYWQLAPDARLPTHCPMNPGKT